MIRDHESATATDLHVRRDSRNGKHLAQPERRAIRGIRWTTGAVFAVIVGGIVCWHSGLKYRFMPKRFGVVEPGRIYRSGQISKWQIGGVLDRHEIRGIVDLNGRDPGDEHQQAEIEAARRRGISVKRFGLDGRGIGDLRCYADVLQEMDRAERKKLPLLVHCHAGSSRTGAAVAFYRLLIQKWSGKDALQEMRSYGWRPHETRRLIRFMNANMKPLAKLLVQRGVLKAIPERIPHLDPSTE